MSKAYRVPPADLIGMTDPVAGYCINRAVWRFGTALENEVHDKTHKLKKDTDIATKSQQIFTRWLMKPGEVIKGQFRDPMLR